MYRNTHVISRPCGVYIEIVLKCFCSLCLTFCNICNQDVGFSKKPSRETLSFTYVVTWHKTSWTDTVIEHTMTDHQTFLCVRKRHDYDLTTIVS